MHAIDALIELALEEDIGPGDITTDHLIPPGLCGKATITAKEPLTICGYAVARKVFERLDGQVRFRPCFEDGDAVGKGACAAEIEGSLAALLTGERTALNFLQRLSGIATLVRSYVDGLAGKPVKLVDTRKTTPGWRILEKYAVRMGGAHNHRMGLYDGVLIKDNHIAVCGGIRQAVERIRAKVHHLIKIEVEAASLDQVSEALAARVDVIMLDNMNQDQIRQAVQVIDGRALVEVSGGVTQKNIARMAATGVDLISVGALTHSARAMDLSMQIAPA
jgi:nicotinate-nucleotide pyrophosphorylase (carboxylating)